MKNWTHEEKIVFSMMDGRAGYPPGGFHRLLIRACAAADSENLRCLRLGFPKLVDAFQRWRRGELHEEFAEWESR